MFKPALWLTIAMAMASGPAFAGSYADGFGSTITEATDNALKAAEAAVKSRGSGCVGPGKDGKTQGTIYVGQKDGVFHVQAHYNHHNGSCGIKKSLEENIKAMGF